MQIIPVIDLKQDLVVHARRGERTSYRPIETPLSATPDPLDVITGLMTLHPFTSLYIADLDAIAGGADNGAAMARIRARFPHLDLWLDCGISSVASARHWLGDARIHPVLGSESQSNLDTLKALAGENRIILSLDYRGADYVGPPEIADTPDLWPARVIAMTLARVGSASGPDLDRLRQIKAQAGPARRIFAAGGVRSAGDFDVLAVHGIAGALVATALHDGGISAADLTRQ